MANSLVYVIERNNKQICTTERQKRKRELKFAVMDMKMSKSMRNAYIWGNDRKRIHHVVDIVD